MPRFIRPRRRGATRPLRYRGYVFDPETGLYYLQSRYYDPEIGRFLNADAFVSTGQGQLGNNMFAYCLNNPMAYSDACGFAPYHVTAHLYEPGMPYYEKAPPKFITDQKASDVGSKSFGVSAVSFSGCGAVATYNAMIMLNNNVSFDSVLDYYNHRVFELTAFGSAGVLPDVVAGYFVGLGYDVYVTDNLDGMDVYSQSADACIMFYMFPRNYQVLWVSLDLFGAHFVAYDRVEDGYIGYNTGSPTGISYFAFPSEFAYGNSRFYAVGIFIYKKGGG